MFTNEIAHDSLTTELTELDGIAAIIGNRSNDRYTLYQFVLDPGASPNEVADAISSRYGDSVTVETASSNLLPDNMAFIAIVCVGLLPFPLLSVLFFSEERSKRCLSRNCISQKIKGSIHWVP